MAKFKIRATTFNGTTVEPEIELFAVIGNKDSNLPLNIYNTIKEKIIESLKIEDFNFYIISKDLENLQNSGIKIDTDSLIENIFPLVLNEMENSNFEIKNQKLIRAIQLFEEKNSKDAKELFDQIDAKELSKFEYDEYILLKFKLEENKENLFRDYIRLFQNNPIKTKQIYFEYIKYLEDQRDERKPFKLMEEFEEKYPISELSKEELGIYYYLKGRSYYARGEFLLAIKYLKLAKDNVERDEKLLSAIYNTVTNAFTDNLFFNEALELANRAYDLREKLKLPQKVDSISLIGGIYFKSANFKTAYNYYKKAEELQTQKSGRIYNYLAKSAIMLKDFNKAREYIEKSSKYDDNKGFLVLIKLLLLFKKKEYQGMINLYKQTILLLENRKKFDKVVLGWGYALLAQSAFDEKRYEDGIEYLYKSVDFFIEDRYILESFYVSLYLYQYEVPDNIIEKFNELIYDFDLKSRFYEYVLKHSNFLKNYTAFFDIEESKENNLELFYNKTKDIDSSNYNPKMVKEILNSFCLI